MHPFTYQTSRIVSEEQYEIMRLATILAIRPQTLIDLVLEEIEHRKELFARLYRETPFPSTGETPKLAALRSVNEDITHGRL